MNRPGQTVRPSAITVRGMIAFILARLAWSCLFASVFLILTVEPPILRHFSPENSRLMTSIVNLVSAPTFFAGMAILVFYFRRYYLLPRPYPPSPAACLLGAWVVSLAIYGGLLLPGLTRVVKDFGVAQITQPFLVALNILCALALIAESLILARSLWNSISQKQRNYLKARVLVLAFSISFLAALLFIHPQVSDLVNKGEQQVKQGEQQAPEDGSMVYFYILTALWFTNLILLLTPELPEADILKAEPLKGFLGFGKKKQEPATAGATATEPPGL